MKRVIQLICAFVISISVVGTTTNVSAQEPPACDNLVITNTGSGSTNNIECTVDIAVTVECINNIYVLDANSQTAVSGAATVDSGTAISGSASNSNNQTVQIGASCGETTPVTPVTPVTPTTPATPTTPTAATPATGLGAAAPKKVAALPYTAATNTPVILMIITASLVTLFFASRVAIFAYSRASQK